PGAGHLPVDDLDGLPYAAELEQRAVAHQGISSGALAEPGTGVLSPATRRAAPRARSRARSRAAAFPASAWPCLAPGGQAQDPRPDPAAPRGRARRCRAGTS
ncbi:hypothetical protein, partial [Actinophytocola sp.]|uniref:hypothetical protein n=1 Tax=Actinophytocola sp. TaxID=1872138 RepID=UPI003D6A0739